MVKHAFLTFGGPDANYHNAVKRVCAQTRELNVFDEIIGVTDIDLINDKKFYSRHRKFLEKNKRGYGYWLWKSYIVKKQLEKMNENDVLVYADAGCVMNVNGKKRLYEYFDMVNNSEYGMLSFQMDMPEKSWTKMDIFKHLDAYELLETGQLIATTFVIRKCEHTMKLVNKWYNTCNDYDLINDSPSKSKNDATFKENRHDQSVWSVIRKKYGSIIINDETYFVNWNDGINNPILAMRQRY
jgi:hypothetical protein